MILFHLGKQYLFMLLTYTHLKKSYFVSFKFTNQPWFSFCFIIFDWKHLPWFIWLHYPAEKAITYNANKFSKGIYSFGRRRLEKKNYKFKNDRKPIGYHGLSIYLFFVHKFLFFFCVKNNK